MTEKRLNILFLASWYPNKVHPKNGNFVQQHAKAVSQHCNVASLHIIANKQDKKFEVETVDNNGVLEVIVYYKKIKGSSPIHKYQKLKRRHEAHVLGYHEVLNTLGKIDLTHLNVTYPAGLFALYLKQRHKIPFIITEHSTAYLPSSTHQFSKIEIKWIKKIGLNADLICPVSQDLATNMKQFGINNKYQVVPNVVNTAIFEKSSSENQTDKKNILHISHLKDDHKNVTGILRVIKKLSEQRHDFSITIAGDGDTEAIKKYAKELNIPDRAIKYKGELSITEVAELMNAADVFLLFSNYENLPCVISESLVMGVPVISSDVGGIKEMLTKENGILIPKGDESELLTQLNSIIDNLANYNTNDISDKAIQTYSFNAVSNQFAEIYNNILKVG